MISLVVGGFFDDIGGGSWNLLMMPMVVVTFAGIWGVDDIVCFMCLVVCFHGCWYLW